ncbi:phasin family protein [Pistricoccus aurantiacus]|uniref:phasin family protein n=1 Tax=Pistricoccus aurantiacus TaxID=1883414 RepID=UPI0036434B3D
MANTNVKENVDQAQQQFASVFADPARSLAGKMLDYTEKLANVQRGALNNYAELGFQQMRSALDVKNAEDLQSYMEEQQEAAKKVSEQMKSDMEEVRSISQEFMQQNQEVTQDAMQRGQEATEKNMERGQQKMEEEVEKGEKEAKESAKDTKSSSSKK